ncbi:MAG TPA: twin-arginine translocase TatA/TatE family subunit [Anaerolineae bacterium]|nr:twin-arginine translocase TatA/TatE family subunit [Anaerolineae bacterium]
MDILNVGLPELLFIFVIALMVFGPRRLPEIAVKAGKFVADLRRMSNSLLAEWQREINVSNQLDEFKKVKDELQGAKQDLAGVRREVGTAGRSLINETKQVTASINPVNQQKPVAPSTAEAAAEASLEAQATTGTRESKIEPALQSPVPQNGTTEPASVPRTSSIPASASPPPKPVAETTTETPAESGGLGESLPIPNGSVPMSVKPSTTVTDD